jgi:hypothetical protein
MQLKFSNEVWYWRGPSPFHFVTVPELQSLRILKISKMVTYGWGAIPVLARVGETEWETSIFPKDGLYLVPLKNAVRAAEKIELGQVIAVELFLDHALAI